MSRVRVTLDQAASETYKHMTVKKGVPRYFSEPAEVAYWLTQRGRAGLVVEELPDTFEEPVAASPIIPEGYKSWVPGGKNRARIDMVPPAPVPVPGSDSASEIEVEESFDVEPEADEPQPIRRKGRKNAV